MSRTSAEISPSHRGSPNGYPPADWKAVTAVKHPLRVRILNVFRAREEMSPSGLSDYLDQSLGVTSYHVKVLYRTCGLLELVRKVPRRGAVEHFYRLRPDAQLGWLLAEDGPTIALRGFVAQLTAAPSVLDPEQADDRDIVDWRAVLVDEVGRREVADVLSDANRRVTEIGKASKKRTRAGNGSSLRLLVAMVALEGASDVGVGESRGT